MSTQLHYFRICGPIYAAQKRDLVYDEVGSIGGITHTVRFVYAFGLGHSNKLLNFMILKYDAVLSIKRYISDTPHPTSIGHFKVPTLLNFLSKCQEET